uniref:Uncharacterized protein n=1 Tax=Avena sativa TaxID=4498 RepID=A0ACD5XCT9_AVESA
MARLLYHVVLAVSLLALAWPASCQRLPVLVPVTKDRATSLHTIPFHYGTNLVVDIAGPLVWSACQSDHLPAEFPCNSETCQLASIYPAPGCNATECDHDERKHRMCTVYPYNPVTGACAAGSLVHTRFVANTTNGKNPVEQVSVRAVSACATTKLLKSLPRGATGVAGLAGSGVALPAQVASAQKVAKKFLLCLSRGGVYGDGVAIFGGGPLHLTAQPETDYTQSLEYTPLFTKEGNPAYYVSVKSIALENTPVPVSTRTLDAGGVVLCTRVPYTFLRPDVYLPFADAFRTAMKAQKAQEVKVVAPFGLCYNTSTLANTRLGYLVPTVTLALEGGKKWTMTGVHSMVDVKRGTACLAFVQMKGVKAGDGKAPAVLIGGFQLENFVLQFDLEKKRLGFFKLPFFTNCGHFNFTRRSG